MHAMKHEGKCEKLIKFPIGKVAQPGFRKAYNCCDEAKFSKLFV